MITDFNNIYDWMSRLNCLSEDSIKKGKQLIMEADAGVENLRKIIQRKFPHLSSEEVKEWANSFRDYFGVLLNPWNPYLKKLGLIAFDELNYKKPNADTEALEYLKIMIALMDKEDDKDPSTFRHYFRSLPLPEPNNLKKTEGKAKPNFMTLFNHYKEQVYDELEKRYASKGNGDEKKRNPNYELIKINGYDEAHEWGKWTGYKGDGTPGTGQLCYTTGTGAWGNYSRDDERDCYMALHKGWEDIKPPTEEEVKRTKKKTGYPKDAYGESIIWFFVDHKMSDIPISNVRWNHGYHDFQGVDFQYKAKDIVDLLGMNLSDFGIIPPLLKIKEINDRISRGDDIKEVFDKVTQINDKCPSLKENAYLVYKEGLGCNILFENGEFLWKDRSFWFRTLDVHWFETDNHMFMVTNDRIEHNFLKLDGSLLWDKTRQWFYDLNHFRDDQLSYVTCEFEGKGYNFLFKDGSLLDENIWFDKISCTNFGSKKVWEVSGFLGKNLLKYDNTLEPFYKSKKIWAKNIEITRDCKWCVFTIDAPDGIKQIIYSSNGKPLFNEMFDCVKTNPILGGFVVFKYEKNGWNWISPEGRALLSDDDLAWCDSISECSGFLRVKTGGEGYDLVRPSDGVVVTGKASEKFGPFIDIGYMSGLYDNEKGKYVVVTREGGDQNVLRLDDENMVFYGERWFDLVNHVYDKDCVIVKRGNKWNVLSFNTGNVIWSDTNSETNWFDMVNFSNNRMAKPIFIVKLQGKYNGLSYDGKLVFPDWGDWPPTWRSANFLTTTYDEGFYGLANGNLDLLVGKKDKIVKYSFKNDNQIFIENEQLKWNIMDIDNGKLKLGGWFDAIAQPIPSANENMGSLTACISLPQDTCHIFNDDLLFLNEQGDAYTLEDALNIFDLNDLFVEETSDKAQNGNIIVALRLEVGETTSGFRHFLYNVFTPNKTPLLERWYHGIVPMWDYFMVQWNLRCTLVRPDGSFVSEEWVDDIKMSDRYPVFMVQKWNKWETLDDSNFENRIGTTDYNVAKEVVQLGNFRLGLFHNDCTYLINDENRMVNGIPLFDYQLIGENYLWYVISPDDYTSNIMYTNGETLLDTTNENMFTNHWSVREGFMCVETNDGHYNMFSLETGKLLINSDNTEDYPIYCATYFSCGYWMIQLDGMHGLNFMDRQGKMLLEYSVPDADSFRNGHASVWSENGHEAYIDTEGNLFDYQTGERLDLEQFLDDDNDEMNESVNHIITNILKKKLLF